jgi:hypothetical protein
VNRIDESQAAAHEIARQDEADGTGGQDEDKLYHRKYLSDNWLCALQYETWGGKIHCWLRELQSVLWYANRGRYNILG